VRAPIKPLPGVGERRLQRGTVRLLSCFQHEVLGRGPFPRGRLRPVPGPGGGRPRPGRTRWPAPGWPGPCVFLSAVS